MGWSYGENNEVKRLRRAIETHPHDAAQAKKDQELLESFWRRFPRERLRELTLEEYAQGTGNGESFCNWIENRLSSLGKYTPGNARGHYIYKDGDDWYRLRTLQDKPIEEAMRQIAAWHAQAVELGGGEQPEQLDRMPDFKNVAPRVLKLLSNYNPDRYLPILSPDHLEHFLKLFGVPRDKVPKGGVARNLLLHELYEEAGRPAGLTPFEFMRVLYEPEFDPAQTLIRFGYRLKAAARLFRWLVGDQGFAAERYLKEERDYKVHLAQAWQKEVTPALLAEALRSGEEVACAARITAFLTDQKWSNLLSWHYHAAVKGLSEPADARVLVGALRDLLSPGDGTVPDIGSFNEAMRPLYERLNEGTRPGASRSLPTLALWLSDPGRQYYIQSDSFSRMRKALTGGTANAGTLTTVEYSQARELAGAVKALLVDLGPRDMIDIQGFCWLLFGAAKVWFGGTSYDGRNVLPAFLQRGVFGIGWARDTRVRELLGTGAADKAAREVQSRQLRELIPAGPARDAVLSFSELAGTPGSLIVAETAYFDQSDKSHKLRVRAVGRTRSTVSFDEDLGHLLEVAWSGQPDVKLPLRGELYPSLAGTLAAQPLEKALDALAGRVIIEEPDPPGPHPPPPPPPPVLDPLNLILYGPPGTGKTRELLERQKEYEDGKRWEMVTFHSAYSYEEFIEGLRPVEKEGQVRYEVVKGIFRLLAERAEKDPGRRYALFIDEINRGNIAALFGELITLIETDKRGRKLRLPYSKEEFSVPPNLDLIGTMNTADRSIALLDVALRRRFRFQEVGVDIRVLRQELARRGFSDGVVDGVDVPELLERMNERIHYLGGREQQIGHAWLMGMGSLVDLRDVFDQKILPLLAEYFYEDWGKICLVLGEDPERPADTDLIAKTMHQRDHRRRLFGKAMEDEEDRTLYTRTASSAWTAAHFQKIYRIPNG